MINTRPWLTEMLVVCLAILLFAGCDAGPADSTKPQVRIVKFGTVLPDTHPTYAAMLYFAQLLDEVSGGRMKVQTYGNSQLGDANSLLEGLRQGNIEMATVSAAPVAQTVPLANALSMPFIFRNAEHQARVLDGEVGERIREAARPLGLDVLGYFCAGTRNITTKKGPIEKPEDLKGRKIRVMNSKLMVESVQALGASAVAMNQGEVYTALQQGVLDGWENNPPTIVTFRMYETGCIYFAWTHHLAVPDILLAGGKFRRKLNDREREWLEQAARQTVIEQRQLWKEYEAKALEEMRANGMKINEVDIELFKARVEPVYTEYYEKYGDLFEQLCETIRSIQ